ncbi:hypothetical protein L1O03_09850 [Corynebacterium uropygiale]|uniref:ABC transmembrane type-1 domain-containing protein n=1 Tax=Corynebacterium uropygiale TaxID=1775911 RepID=A0A9X1QPZ2_9CORY|nr:hypothetical protein [Corynebacterium uropygiale]MCF4007467.1 hypothetical protein [Corynebacterium uropygiale]
MSTSTPQRAARGSRQRRRAAWSGALGALPFFLFMAAFLILPIVANTLRAFQDPRGRFTLETMAEALGPTYRSAFLQTMEISVATSLIGGVLGMVLAWALVATRRPRWLHGVTSSFAAMASQSGGITLAYAFIALLGTQGVLTGVIDVLAPGLMERFPITGTVGVSVVYLYFQVPLMAVLMMPAMRAVRPAWRDAAITLGATRAHYLRDIVIPILWHPLLGAMLLLFANAFAAYATAYALAGGTLNLVSIVIGFFISGNVLFNPGLAAALVTWMMLIIIAAVGVRVLLTRKSEQWLSS